LSDSPIPDSPIPRLPDYPIHMDLAARVRRAIERQALVQPGGRVLVAVSGGADSVALLFLLRELERAGDLVLAGVAHLNHRLRAADSDDDETFCRDLAARLKLPFRSDRVDIAAIARERKRSIEDTARFVRYRFLESVADGMRADVVAVAHTRDDQAETFLLRLLRGAGTRGLAAIRPSAGRIVRPLLDVERDALRMYLADLGEPFREDASNADVAIARNRVRHELLPYLQRHFSPAVVDVLAREAALARVDEGFLQEHVNELRSAIVISEEPGKVTLNAEALRTAPLAIAARIVQASLESLSGGRPVSFEHIENVIELCDPPSPLRGYGGVKAVSLPGQRAVRSGEVIVLSPFIPPKRREGGAEGEVGESNRANDFAFSLSIPGEVELTPLGFAVAAERLDAGEPRPSHWTSRGLNVGVAAEPLQLPLVVRSRRPGDRFRPVGAPRVRKLQGFPPLVVDAAGRIVWVVGESVAEDFRVTDPSRGVILLTVRHLGGPG
jgi:tRNA(Ile)-lysidine synthase